MRTFGSLLIPNLRSHSRSNKHRLIVHPPPFRVHTCVFHRVVRQIKYIDWLIPQALYTSFYQLCLVGIDRGCG